MLTLSPETPVPTALLTPAQVSAYIGIAKDTLYTWRSRRPGYGPPAVIVGGLLRYSRPNLAEWSRRQEHNSTPLTQSTPTTADPDALMMPEEVATYLGVTLRTLMKWRLQENPAGPPPTSIGRSYRYRLGTVLAWVSQQEEANDQDGAVPTPTDGSNRGKAPSAGGSVPRPIRNRNRGPRLK